MALVIGNGESRSGIELSSFGKNIIVGCNALHRDTQVDHLVCCDKRMVEESLKSGNTKNTKIYVRQDYINYYSNEDTRINLLPALPYSGKTKADDPEHWGSGPYAVLLAANLPVSEIKLLGFDLYSTEANTVNNIYNGTENYSSVKSKPIDYSFWQYQIAKVFEYFPKTKFVIHNKQGWKLPTPWQRNNVSVKFFDSSS
jgi:hypothetical protein